MYRTQPLTSWIVPNLFKWSLLRFKIPKPAFPLSIYFIFFLVFFSRQKLIYLLHFNIKIITSTNNSRNQDISFNSVRYLFCQLHYVLCNFLRRNRVFFKLFVPQCNNTILGAKSTIQPLTWWIIPSVITAGIDFPVVTYFVLFLFFFHFMWFYVFNNGFSYN